MQTILDTLLRALLNPTRTHLPDGSAQVNAKVHSAGRDGAAVGQLTPNESVSAGISQGTQPR